MRIHWRFVVLWLACCLVATLIASAQPAVESAYRLHQQGRLAEAVTAYRQVLAADPSLFDVRTNLGAALAALGRYDEAIAEYRAALTRAPGHLGIRRNLALAYAKSARLQEAISEIESWPEEQRRSLDVALLLADCYFRLGKEARTVAILSPHEGTAADHPGFLYLLGTARIRTGDASGGQRLVDRILRQGDSAEAQMIMGSAHVMGGEFDRAAAAFRRAIEINPTLPLAHSHLGKTLLELGDHNEALRHFELEIETNPTDFDAQLLSGVILRERQQWKAALAALEHARKIRPTAMEVPYQIALALLGAGMTAEACRELEQLLDAAPGFREARVSLATAYARLGQREKAAEQQALLRSRSGNPAKPQ